MDVGDEGGAAVGSGVGKLTLTRQGDPRLEGTVHILHVGGHAPALIWSWS